MRLRLLLIMAVLSVQTLGLEIDEKLTLRILELSSTKKTALINRGLEDGLVVGDHAKFFLTTGVVARGVVVKASPSRSVWSFYRLVNDEEIEKNKVMNLKIASAVKITEDPSKSLVEVKTTRGSDRVKMVMDEKAQAENLSNDDMDELKSLAEGPSKENTYSKKTDRSLEVFGLLNFTSLSGDFDDGTATTTTSASSLDFSAGIEKFFPTSSSFLKNMSVYGFATKRSSTSGGELETTVDWTEFGAGVSYYFYNLPHEVQKVVFYGTSSFALGSASYTVEAAEGSSVPSSVNNDLTGSSQFLSFGVGSRYLLSNNFSAIGLVDYIQSSTSFDTDEGDTSVLTVSGPRVRVGMAYRW